jgi:hypothetical protein
MRTFIYLILTLTSCIAADRTGSGANPFGIVQLNESFSLSFFTKESDDSLFWRLSWKPNESSSSSVSSGSGVPSQAPFVYFWDDDRKIFWFAAGQILHKYDLSSAMTGSTTSRTSMITDYKAEKDFPAQMVPMVESLLQKE